MDLKILRYFLTVAQVKNITKAADQLNITQPTLSRQLILLEESIGVSLFIKEKRTIELTDEGKFLQKRAREILDLADKTLVEITDEKVLISGTVSIGLIESFSSDELYKQMKFFTTIYQNVVFNIHNGSHDDLLNKMENGTIDLCLLLDPVDTSKYNVIRLSEDDHWGVIVRQDDPLSINESIEIIKLINLPLVLPLRKSLINEIENWFGKDKYKLTITARYNMVSSAIQCAENKIGYPFCLNSSMIKMSKSVCFRPLSPRKKSQSIIIWKKNRNFNSATELYVKNIYHFFNNLGV